MEPVRLSSEAVAVPCLASWNWRLIPATFEGGMKGYQQMNGFIRRRKVPDWAIQNAWNYKP